MPRGEVAEAIARHAGAEVLLIDEVADGWPSFARLRISERWVPTALYVAPIGLSNRHRDDVERRFQNPGSARPIVSQGDRILLLLGFWGQDPHVHIDDPVLVSANANLRLNRNTRFSLFPRLSALQSATTTGWAQERTVSGEQMLYLHPRLLGIAGFATAERIEVPEDAVAVASQAAGFGATHSEPAAERVRRIGMTAVRDARFARDVINAYGGQCALCGLAYSGLVEAAHIYPVAAPDAPDIVQNGVALCRNHHAAFDRFMIWVDSDTRQVTLHPDLKAAAAGNPAVRAFVDGTATTLTPPSTAAACVDREMLIRRHEFFRDQYSWMRRRR